MEIERKWLIKEFPRHLEEVNRSIVRQCYLSVDPEIRLREEMVRYDPKSKHLLTLKGDGTLSRDEKEMELTREEYAAMRQFSSKHDIVKHTQSYLLPGGKILICSEVDFGICNGAFMYAEVEFESEEEAKAFVLPFEAVEVTDDPQYKMKNYWRRTRGE